MLNDLLTAALDALDTEAAAVPGNATMVALKNAGPKTRPRRDTRRARMAVRAGFVGASLHVLAFERMNLTRRECYQIVTTFQMWPWASRSGSPCGMGTCRCRTVARAGRKVL